MCLLGVHTKLIADLMSSMITVSEIRCEPLQCDAINANLIFETYKKMLMIMSIKRGRCAKENENHNFLVSYGLKDIVVNSSSRKD